jgi:hypothetical protein
MPELLSKFQPMTIFKALDDPDRGERLKALGITDEDFVRYIIARAKGASKDAALKQLLQGKKVHGDYDTDFVRGLVERFPIPE